MMKATKPSHRDRASAHGAMKGQELLRGTGEMPYSKCRERGHPGSKSGQNWGGIWSVLERQMFDTRVDSWPWGASCRQLMERAQNRKRMCFYIIPKKKSKFVKFGFHTHSHLLIFFICKEMSVLRLSTHVMLIWVQQVRGGVRDSAFLTTTGAAVDWWTDYMLSYTILGDIREGKN